MSKPNDKKDYSHIYDYFSFTSEGDLSPPPKGFSSRQPTNRKKSPPPFSSQNRRSASTKGDSTQRPQTTFTTESDAFRYGPTPTVQQPLGPPPPWNGLSFDFSKQNTFEPAPPTTTREIHQNRDGTQTAIETISSGNLNEFNTLVNRQFDEAGAIRRANERLYDQGQKLDFFTNQHQTNTAHQEFIDELNTNSKLAQQQMKYAYQARKDELDTKYADNHDARRYDLDKLQIDNSQQLTNDRIRLAQLAFDLNQEALRTSDERALTVKDKIDVNNSILGMEKQIYESSLFKKFNMVAPNNEHEANMRSESDWVVLLEKKKETSYVRSKLFHGVRNVDANKKKIFFYNGDVVEFKKKPNTLYHIELPGVVNTVIVHEYHIMEAIHGRNCPCSECRLY